MRVSWVAFKGYLAPPSFHPPQKALVFPKTASFRPPCCYSCDVAHTARPSNARRFGFDRPLGDPGPPRPRVVHSPLQRSSNSRCRPETCPPATGTSSALDHTLEHLRPPRSPFKALLPRPRARAERCPSSAAHSRPATTPMPPSPAHFSILSPANHPTSPACSPAVILPPHTSHTPNDAHSLPTLPHYRQRMYVAP